MDNKSVIITDSEADESIKSLRSGKVLPSLEFFGSYSTGSTKADLANNDSYSSQITAAELRLLKAIVENPMRPSSDYPKLAKTSPNTFQKVRPILIDKRLIREYKLQTVGRGRCTIRLGPTEQGKKILRDYDNNPRSD